MNDYQLRSARYIAAEYMEKMLTEGCVAVDATMGNGHDTEQLARLVGQTGHVYAMDIQPDALSQTRMRLAQAGLEDRVTLVLASHEELLQYVPVPPRMIVFNLGWLPGGDKSVTTLLPSTRKAISQALDCLAPQGMLLVCCYPGHEEGKKELVFLRELFSSLRPQAFNCLEHCFLNAGPDAPVCFAVQKQR